MEEIWSIQQVTKAAKVTSRTLRYYDEIGLLTPDVLTSGGKEIIQRQISFGFTGFCS